MDNLPTWSPRKGDEHRCSSIQHHEIIAEPIILKDIPQPSPQPPVTEQPLSHPHSSTSHCKKQTKFLNSDSFLLPVHYKWKAGVRYGNEGRAMNPGQDPSPHLPLRREMCRRALWSPARLRKELKGWLSRCGAQAHPLLCASWAMWLSEGEGGPSASNDHFTAVVRKCPALPPSVTYSFLDRLHHLVLPAREQGAA